MTWVHVLQHIYQVLHLLLQPGHGLLSTNRKHKSVHVVIVESHFDLLQTEGRSHFYIINQIPQEASEELINK